MSAANIENESASDRGLRIGINATRRAFVEIAKPRFAPSGLHNANEMCNGEAL